MEDSVTDERWDRILTINQVADALRVNPSTIYRLLKKGRLPGFKVGRDWRFSSKSIALWCAQAQAQQAASINPTGSVVR